MAATAEIRLPVLGALPVCLFPENPNRLVSLWDMVRKFNAAYLVWLVHELEREQTRLISFQVVGAGGQAPLPEVKQSVIEKLTAAELIFSEAGMTECLDPVRSALHGLRQDDFLDNSVVKTIVNRLLGDILKNVDKRTFLILNGDNSLIDNDELFGEVVAKAFPSAKDDIREAGNCLAVECTTAAVFHLMRAAEHGLRALARDRRIKVIRGPLELATWDDIIKELEKAEQAIQNYPRTLVREKQLWFYHGAMMEFRRFKNKFRNQIMHTRDNYDLHEAKSAYEHVKDFMVILAGKISEKKRTPMIWRKA